MASASRDRSIHASASILPGDVTYAPQHGVGRSSDPKDTEARAWTSSTGCWTPTPRSAGRSCGTSRTNPRASSRRSGRGSRPRAGARGCSRCRATTAGGRAARGRTTGRTRCTRSSCCGCWVSTPRATQARRATELVRDHVTWEGGYPTDEWAGNAFFAGEVEPCINGVVVAVGAYFGQDVRALGGPAARGAARRRRLELRGRERRDGVVVRDHDPGPGRPAGVRADDARSGGGPGRPPPRAGVPAGAAAVPSQVDGRGDRRRLAPVRLPDLALLRRAAWPGLSARGLGRTRTAHPRGHRCRRAKPWGRRPMAAPAGARGRGASRYGRGRGQAEPLEHPAGPAGARLGRGRRWRAFRPPAEPRGRSRHDRADRRPRVPPAGGRRGLARRRRRRVHLRPNRIVRGGCPAGAGDRRAARARAPPARHRPAARRRHGAARRDRGRLHGHEHPRRRAGPRDLAHRAGPGPVAGSVGRASLCCS